MLENSIGTMFDVFPSTDDDSLSGVEHRRFVDDYFQAAQACIPKLHEALWEMMHKITDTKLMTAQDIESYKHMEKEHADRTQKLATIFMDQASYVAAFYRNPPMNFMDTTDQA